MADPTTPVSGEGPADELAPAAEPTRARISRAAIFWTAVVGALTVYSLSVMWTNILPTRNTLAATEQRLRILERENAAHESMLRHTDLECELLERDPWTVQRILRDELRMTRPGEQIIK